MACHNISAMNNAITTTISIIIQYLHKPVIDQCIAPVQLLAGRGCDRGSWDGIVYGIRIVGDHDSFIIISLIHVGLHRTCVFYTVTQVVRSHNITN